MPSALLTQAADLIERDGWWHAPNRAMNPRGSRCTMDAIRRSVQLDAKAHVGRFSKTEHMESMLRPEINEQLQRYQTEEPRRLGAAVAQHLNLVGEVGGVIRWNDTVGRTQEEVVAALRAAAMVTEDRNVQAY